MKTKLINGIPFSSMSLGTVQLGTNYGIANNDGKPSMEQAFSVLQTAIDGGVTALDTAAGYGDSEKVIGEFLKQRGGKKDLFITTKYLLKSPETATKAEVQSELRRSVENSLTNLGIEQIDCLMSHRANFFEMYGDFVVEELEKMQKEGIIAKAGVSFYLPSDLDCVYPYDILTMAQGPMSLMDHAIRDSGCLAKLAEKNIDLIVRSVFLQGLFFMDPDTFTDPDLVEAAAPPLRIIRKFAEELGISVAELAVAYIRDMPGVTGIVLGAEKPEQVAQNLPYFADDAVVLPADKRAYIDENCSANIAQIMKVLSRPKG